MPYLIQSSVERQHNVIVRPRGATIELVQLDDLSQAGLERLKTTAFLILTTSPENYQAWVAVRECDAELARRLRCAAAPIRAPLAPVESQATLISNAKYAPNFPVVEILEATPKHTVVQVELERLG